MSQTNTSRRHSQNVNTDRVEYHLIDTPTSTEIAEAYTSYTFIPAPEAITLIAEQPKIIKISGYHYRLLGTVDPGGQTWDSSNTFPALYSNGEYIIEYRTASDSTPNYLKIGTDTKGYKYYEKVNEESYYELIGKMPNELEYGELGIGRSAKNEVMYIKNSDGQMVEFRSYKANANYVNNKITDETRYFAKSSSGAAVTTMTASLVDSRNFTIENNKPINGTKVDVYFSTAHTTETATLNINNTGAFALIYNDSAFDTTLIEAGTTLALVFDEEYNSNTGCYRVVGGVGSGADPVTTQLITVNNPIGSYAVGDEIEIGTLLETIIRNMLMVVIDVIKTLPTLTWSWTPGTVEVGATMTPSSTGYTQTDGNYKSADPTKYTNAEFDAKNGTTGGVLTAGCTLGSVTTPSAVTKTSETSNTFTASYIYSNATNVPKMSNGANSSNLITSGSASASKTGYWRYKYFIGGTAYISNGNYSSVFTSKSSLDNIVQLEGQTSKWGWCSTGTTNAGRLKTVSGATSLVLVLPYNVGNHTATITNTTFLSQNVKDNWIYQNDITYALDNGTNVTYKVYVIHNAATGLEYTDIQFI